MNKFSTQVRAIFLVLTFFLVVPAMAQEYQFRPGLWKRKASQVSLILINGDTINGLLVFVDKEGIMVLPDAEYLTPIAEQNWEPHYYRRDSLAVVNPSFTIRPLARATGYFLGMMVTSIGIGYANNHLVGIALGGAFGLLSGAIGAPVAFYFAKLKKERLRQVDPEKKIDWAVFKSKAWSHTLVRPSEKEGFLTLQSQVSTDTASWLPLRQVSPVMRRMYLSSKPRLVFDINQQFAYGTLTRRRKALDSRLGLLDFHLSAGCNIGLSYFLNQHWSIALGYSGWNFSDRDIDYWYVPQAGEDHGYGWNQHLSGQALYLQGIWQKQLANTPLHLSLGVGTAIEKVQLDLFTQQVRYSNLFFPVAPTLEITRDIDLFYSQKITPTAIGSFRLGYQIHRCQWYIGTYGKWMPSLSTPSLTYEYTRSESESESMLVRETLEAKKHILSRIDFNIGLRYTLF